MANQPNRAALIAALDQEREQLLALLSEVSEAEWRTLAREDGWTVHDIANHLADSTYGLALMITGQAPASSLPIDAETGWFSAGDYNEQRRQKNRDLPREKILSRMASAFDAARRAIETVEDYDAPATFGPKVTNGYVLQRIIDHSAEHRAHIEALRV